MADNTGKVRIRFGVKSSFPFFPNVGIFVFYLPRDQARDLLAAAHTVRFFLPSSRALRFVCEES